ncbi:hypothetical protein CGZ92_10225 [Parenemella sanctibonifatiensis]|uniref:Peptidase S8/S53 domain-containing protein n=1 Tax=Parenemella sanctibonifatiensis TaxID=2016505 RepID=A0A255E2Q4_9ACTN|nr:hypothetical protein CGZ92_10225 [Parenemella sanctibonifatiensis]
MVWAGLIGLPSCSVMSPKVSMPKISSVLTSTQRRDATHIPDPPETSVPALRRSPIAIGVASPRTFHRAGAGPAAARLCRVRRRPIGGTHPRAERTGSGRTPWLRRTLAGLLAVAFMLPIPAWAQVGGGEPYNPDICRQYEAATVDVPPAWQVDRLGLDRVHQLATGRGVTVAVIDTAARYVGSDYLTSQNIQGLNFAGWDLVEENDDGADDCQHGTIVVSLIAGHNPDDGSSDFTGVAPDVRVISMRALQSGERTQGGEPLGPSIRAVRKAIELDVDVINISQQGSNDPQYRAAIQDALDAGIVVVAAAGNREAEDSADVQAFPASYPGVIAVGMVGPGDAISPLSNSHPDMEVTIGAPGADIIALSPTGPLSKGQAFFRGSGTSFATPVVTGVVALMLEMEPDLTPAEVKERLIATADRGAAVPDPAIGWGVVNPYRALTEPVASERETPMTPREPVPPMTRYDMQPIGEFERWLAIGIGAGALLLAIGGVVLHRSFPSGHRRQWKPAKERTDSED